MNTHAAKQENERERAKPFDITQGVNVICLIMMTHSNFFHHVQFTKPASHIMVCVSLGVQMSNLRKKIAI